MARNTRKERLESLLSQKKQCVAVRTAKSPFNGFKNACRCCALGEWKLAVTHLTTLMNLIWTTIVNLNAGANRKP